MITKMATKPASKHNLIYAIDATNKYEVTITRIDNIEDAPDDFLTHDEVIEALGLDPDTGRFSNGINIRSGLITEQLNALSQQAKDKGKKTIIITDDDLLEVFKRGYKVADFVPGLRRVGNRLFINDNYSNQQADKQLKKQHRIAFCTLIVYVAYTINQNHKFCIEISRFNDDRFGTLDFVKKFITFDEIKFDTRYITQETIDLCRLMWDNLDAYFERNKEE